MRWSEEVCACARRRAEVTTASRAVTAAGARHCRAASTGVDMAGIGFGIRFYWACGPSVKMSGLVYCSRFSVSFFPDCLFLMLMIAIRVVNLSSSEQPRRHLFQTSEWLECFCLFQKVCCWRRLHSPQVCCDSCLPSMKAIPDMWFNFAIFSVFVLLKFRLSLVFPIFI